MSKSDPFIEDVVSFMIFHWDDPIVERYDLCTHVNNVQDGEPQDKWDHI